MHLSRKLCLLLLFASPFARGQTAGPTNLTGTQCLGIDSTGLASIGISITGTWSGTIQPSVAIGGDAAQNTQVTPSTSSTAQSTITGNGVFYASTSGTNLFQVCGNSITNTAVVRFFGTNLSSRGRSGSGGSGTVSSVSVTTANGVSGTVATATTTPAITLTLGDITPTSTNGVSSTTMAFMDATSSVQTQLNAKSPIASPTFTGTATTPALIINGNGAVSSTPFSLTGALETGGSGTTTFPYMNFDQDATKPTTWSTSGTQIGINAVNAFAGNFVDFHIHGAASVFSIASSGNITGGGNLAVTTDLNLGANGGLQWGGRAKEFSPADGIVQFFNNAATGFTRLDFGTSSTSFAGLGANGTILTSQLATGAAGGMFLNGGTVRVASNFTTSGVGTALEAITGLTWTLPATGTITFSYSCDLSYLQNTANAAVAFGIKASANPTNIYSTGIQQITIGPPATIVTGTLATLATTTATNIVSGTPTAAATNYTVHLGGTIENPATTANTFTIDVSTGTAADTVTVLRGSKCTVE